MTNKRIITNRRVKRNTEYDAKLLAYSLYRLDRQIMEREGSEAAYLQLEMRQHLRWMRDVFDALDRSFSTWRRAAEDSALTKERIEKSEDELFKRLGEIVATRDLYSGVVTEKK